MYIQECGQEFGSSGRHCQSLSWWSIVWFFTGVSSRTGLGCVGFQTKSQSHKSAAAFGVSAFFQEAKDDAISPEDLAEVPVETGNRKHGMLQPFPSCQPKTCHHRISDSDADFGVCLFGWILDISFNGEFQRFEEIVASGIEGLWYHIVSMQSADCIRRTVFPNACFPRQTKRRRKDAKIPDCCFFPSLANM